MVRTRLIDILQKRLVVLTVAVALASLMAVAARWHWLTDLMSHFVPHYAFITAISAAGLWWCGRCRWAAFAALLCALQLAQLVPYLPMVRPTLAHGPTIKVFQFNVGQRDLTHEVLSDWLQNHADDLDVVVLFEVNAGWKQTLEWLAEHYPSSAMELRDDAFGLALFSRLPNAVARIDYIGALEPPSGIMEIPADAERPPLKIVASHPPPPSGSTLWRARNEQLSALVDYLQAEDEEIALVADLNTTVWSPFYRDLVRHSGLHDAQAGHFYRATWAPYAVPLLFGIPIDHLMISDGLLSLARDFPVRMSSDHRPIVTTLGFQTLADSLRYTSGQ